MMRRSNLLDLYTLLLNHFGAQHWWPAHTPFEVMVGAILTQNTNWRNVEQAINNLKQAEALTLAALLKLSEAELAALIRPAGYYRVKTGRLRNLCQFLNDEHGQDLTGFFAQPTPQVREQLLAIKGIGPETADSILLYAGNFPVFVVDAYTHRILLRHGLIDEDADYTLIQQLFMDNLPLDAQLYNEYHALLVRLGKEYCKKSKPLCESCPLQGCSIPAQ